MRRAELTAKNRNPEIDSINVEWLAVPLAIAIVVVVAATPRVVGS